MTSGGLRPPRRAVHRARVRAGGAWRPRTARAAPGSRSRSSAGAGRRGSSRSRCSIPRACGCARDRGTRPRRLDLRRRATDRLRARATRSPSRSSGPARSRDAAARSASPATAGTASPWSTASPTSGRARSRRGRGWSSSDIRPTGNPPLPVVDEPTRRRSRVERRHAEVDVASSAAGASGRAAAAGRRATPSSSTPRRAQEVVAIYPGPTVVARTPAGMLHVEADEIVVATGAAEIQPVCPGNDLAGILTSRAAERLHARRRPVERRRAPGGVHASVDGRSSASRATMPGHVRAVVTRDAGRRRGRRPARTAIVDLGLAPRDLLARMAGSSIPVTVVGEAAAEHPLPPAPADPRPSCAAAWTSRSRTSRRRGRRASPSSSCSSARRSPASARARAAPACPTCARGSPPAPAPCPNRSPPGPRRARSRSPRPPPTSTVDVFRRTPLHDEHLALGARMDRFGGWWRPWHYGDAVAEYWAVRERVSIGDVSHARQARRVRAGRRRGAGAHLSVPRRGHQARPVALRAAAQRARPRHGRRDDPARVGDAVRALVHVRRRRQRRDVAARLDRHVGPPRPRHGPDDVARRDQRHRAARRGAAPARSASPSRRASSATSTPTSPASRATSCASRSPARPPGSSTTRSTARSSCGARSWPTARTSASRRTASRRSSAAASRRATSSSGWTPSSTRRRAGIGMDWAARMDKPRFLGRASLERTAKLPDDRRWVGFSMDGPAPVEGTPIFDADGREVIGNVTGSWHSPLLGKALMLGWQRRPPHPDRVDDRRPRGGRHAHPVLRSGGPPCPRLTGRRHRAAARRPPRRGRSGRARRPRRRLPGRRSPSSGSRPTRRSSSASASLHLDDADAIVEDEVGFVAVTVDRDDRRAPHRVAAPRRRRGRPGGHRRRPGQARLAARRPRLDRHAGGLRRRPAGPPPMSDYTRTLLPIRWPDRPKPSYDVVIIGGGGHGLSTAYHLATRHGITNVAVARGRLHRERQHRTQHDDHPRQLRHPRGDPLLPALARAVPGPRGGDRRRHPPPDQGHRLARPHRDGDAHRARPLRDEPGLRREDVHAHAGRAQGARPAAGPDRRRPIPGPRRVASRGGRHGPPRPGRLGVRRGRVAARRGPPPAHDGDLDAARGRPGRRRRDRPRARSRPGSCSPRRAVA